MPVQSRLFDIQCNNNEGVGRKRPQVSSGALSIQPKIRKVLVDISNGTHHFGLVQLEYLVHFDQSGYLGLSVSRTEMSLSIWQNCCPQYRSFVSCLQEQWPNARWLGSVLCNRNIVFHWAHGISQHFKPEFLLNGKRPWFTAIVCSQFILYVRVNQWETSYQVSGALSHSPFILCAMSMIIIQMYPFHSLWSFFLYF